MMHKIMWVAVGPVLCTCIYGIIRVQSWMEERGWL